MSFIKGELEINLVDARDLHKREFIRKMDPYVVLKFGKEEFKSQVCKHGGQTPKWDQFFKFNLEDADAKDALKVEVFDQELISHAKIGRLDIPIFLLTEHEGKSEAHEWEIHEFDDADKTRGYIRIGVKFTGSGFEQHKEAARKHREEKERETKAREERYKKELADREAEHQRQEQERLAQEQSRIAQEKAEIAELKAEAAELKAELASKPQVVVVQGGPAKDTLHEHHRLGFDERITSQDGRFFAIFQRDANFVVYVSGGSPLWASNTNDTGATHVTLQKDHNLVVYDGSGVPQWASGTNERGVGKVRLVIQNDGNLVLYDEENTALWASNTSQ